MDVKVLTDIEGKAIKVVFNGNAKYIYGFTDRDRWQPYQGINYSGGELTPISGIEEQGNYYFTFNNVDCSIVDWILNPAPQSL